TARCTFSLIADVVPVLQKTRFVAFGDSITESVLASAQPAPNPYPIVLQRQLAPRYATQQFTVLNEGRGGEQTGGSQGGASRLPGVVVADYPEVPVVME